MAIARVIGHSIAPKNLTVSSLFEISPQYSRSILKNTNQKNTYKIANNINGVTSYLLFIKYSFRIGIRILRNSCKNLTKLLCHCHLQAQLYMGKCVHFVICFFRTYHSCQN